MLVLNGLRNMRFVFFDSNVFLHCRQFEEDVWLEALETESLTIIVPLSVIHELDKHAEAHKSRRVRRHATTVLRRFRELISAAVLSPIGSLAQCSAKLAICFMNTEPLIDYSANSLLADRQDDQLLAAVLEATSKLASVPLLVSRDFALEVKAHARRITFLNPQELALPVEPDEDQLEIKRLEEELRLHASRSPKLKLQFKDKSAFQVFPIVPPREADGDYIESRLRQIQLEVPPLARKEPSEAPPTGTLIDFLGKFSGPSLIQIDKYNQELESYFAEYRQFLIEKLQYRNLSRRTARIELFLSNEGTLPANNVHAHLHFPDGFKLLSHEKYPAPPQEPTPPSLPPTPLEVIASLSSQGSLFVPDLNVPKLLEKRNVSLRRLERSNSYDVEFTVIKSRHGWQELLAPLYVVFDSFETAKSFEIDYQLYSDDTPRATAGKIRVVIES